MDFASNSVTCPCFNKIWFKLFTLCKNSPSCFDLWTWFSCIQNKNITLGKKSHSFPCSCWLRVLCLKKQFLLNKLTPWRAIYHLGKQCTELTYLGITFVRFLLHSNKRIATQFQNQSPWIVRPLQLATVLLYGAQIFRILFLEHDCITKEVTISAWEAHTYIINPEEESGPMLEKGVVRETERDESKGYLKLRLFKYLLSPEMWDRHIGWL